MSLIEIIFYGGRQDGLLGVAVNVVGLSLFPRIRMVERELTPKFPLENAAGHNGALTPFVPAEGGRDRQISET